MHSRIEANNSFYPTNASFDKFVLNLSLLLKLQHNSKNHATNTAAGVSTNTAAGMKFDTLPKHFQICDKIREFQQFFLMK